MVRRGTDLNIFLYLLAVVGMGSVFFTVPGALDDYWYMREVADGGLCADGSFSFIKGWFECARIHWLSDNGRFCNVIGIGFLHLPLWVSHLVSTLAVAATLGLMCMLGRARRHATVSLTFLTAIYILAVPWPDYLFTRVFSYNYVWGGALMLAVIALFLRQRATGWRWALGAGIVFGGWHEGFSFPILCGAVACMAIHPGMLRRDRVWLCIGLLLGGLWLFMAPARTSPTGFGTMVHYSRPFLPLLGDHWLTIIFFVSEGISLAVRRSRRAALAPLVIFAVAVSGVSLAIHLLSYTPRTCTPGVIMEGVGLTYLFNSLCPKPFSRLRSAVSWLCALTWIFITAHLTAAFITGLKFNREERHIIAGYEKSMDTDGVVFADVLGYYKAPWLTLGKPVQNLYTYFAHSSLVGKYYHGPLMKVIPTALRGYREGMGRRLEGDAGFSVCSGWLVAPIDSVPSSPLYSAEFVYGDHVRHDRFPAYSFTGADSTRYLFVLTDTDGLTAVNSIP